MKKKQQLVTDAKAPLPPLPDTTATTRAASAIGATTEDTGAIVHYRFGCPLFLHPNEADRFIASGLVTEADIIRIRSIPRTSR